MVSQILASNPQKGVSESLAELKSLEGREPPSSYVDGVIDTTLDSEWNGKTIRAAVSVSFENALTIHGGMPTARYHAMMIDGANMAGMPAIGMRQIRGYPCLRRVRKEEFNKLKIVQNSPLKYYRRDEIAGKSHHVIVNDKVFRLNKSLIPDDSTDFYRAELPEMRNELVLDIFV